MPRVMPLIVAACELFGLLRPGQSWTDIGGRLLVAGVCIVLAVRAKGALQ